MKRKKNEVKGAGVSLTVTTTASLRGKQSVRATFKLPAATIDAVSIIATHLGIKQKSLFDHLMDDLTVLETIARQIKLREPQKKNRVQKTYVISRKSLSCLEEVAKEFSTPRDMLIEHSVHRLLPLIQQEQIKHRKRKKILQEIAGQMESSRLLLEKTRVLLGEDDQVCRDLETAVSVNIHTFEKIKDYIRKGEIIEQFETEIW